jgi:hypothetical protein
MILFIGKLLKAFILGRYFLPGGKIFPAVGWRFAVFLI